MYNFKCKLREEGNPSRTHKMEHYHCMTLDLQSVAYWYQDKAGKLPRSFTKEERNLMPVVGPTNMHLWRNEWRKSRGNNLKEW